MKNKAMPEADWLFEVDIFAEINSQNVIWPSFRAQYPSYFKTASKNIDHSAPVQLVSVCKAMSKRNLATDTCKWVYISPYAP